MVDDLQHLRFFDGIDRLGEFIMVDEDQLALRCIHNMVAGNVADKLLVCIKYRIGAIPVPQHLDTDVFCQLIRMKTNRVLFHDPFYRRRKIQVTGCIHRTVPGEQDRAVVYPGLLNNLVRDGICPYDNQHPCSKLDTFFLCHCIGSDNDDPFFHFIMIQTLRPGHCNDADLSVDRNLRIVINDRAIDCLTDIFAGGMCQNVDGTRCVVQSDDRNIRFRHHSEQMLCGIDHSAIGTVMFLHDLHCLINRRIRCDCDRSIHLDLRELHPRILQMQRCLKAEPLQQIFRLRIQGTKAAGDRRDSH